MKNLLLTTFLIFNYALFSQDLDWVKTTGSSGIDVGTSMAQDIYGNKYILGEFQDTVDFDPGPSVINLTTNGISWQDFFIQKLDSNGNFIWAKSIAEPQAYLECYSITVDIFGGVYITGQFRDTIDFDPGPGVFNLVSLGNLNGDMFVLKLDANGNFNWVKSMGGPGEARGDNILTNDLGDVFISGSYGDTIDFDPGPSIFNMANPSGPSSGVFIEKLDSNGNFVWVKSILRNNAWGRYVRGMALDGDNGLYITGSFKGIGDFDPGPSTFNLSSLSNYCFYVLKLTENGNFVWAVNPGSPTNNEGSSITIDATKNVYLTGYFKGNSNFNTGVGTFFLPNTGLNDAFLEKLDSNGNFIWAKPLGGISDDFGNIVAVDSLGFVYVTGDFQDVIDIDPGPGINQLTSNGIFDIFLQKLDSSGNFIWGKSCGGIDRDQVDGLFIDNSYNIYLTGEFRDTVDFDLGTGITNIPSNGDYDSFTLKLNQGICSNFSIRYDSISNITCIDSGFVSVQTIYGIPPYNYSWNTVPISNNSIINLSDEGEYTITVTDSNNCTTSSTIYISSQYINDSQNVTICPGDSIFLGGSYRTNTGTYIDTLQSSLVCDSIVSTTVSFGNYNIFRNISICNGDSTLLAGSYQTTNGTYIDSLQSILGCDSIVSTNLTIVSTTPSFTYTDNGSGNYSFNNTTGGFNQYHWAFGDGDTTTIDNPNHTFNINGTFLVVLALDILSIPGPCINYHLDTLVVGGVVSPLPCVSGYVMYQDSSNSDITVINSSVGNNLTYLWDFGDGNTSTLQNPTHIYTTSGPFYLCLTINDGAGCNDMYCDSIGENGVVFKQSGFTINVISTPIITGFNEIKLNSEVSIYPNPTSNLLSIVSNQLNINRISIIDITGKTLKTITIGLNSINVADLSTGIYFIKLITDEKTITKKFVKQ